MSKWTSGETKNSIGYTPNLHKYINVLWETICNENGIVPILNIPAAGKIFKTIRNLTYLGLLEPQIRDKDIAHNPNALQQVCTDIYNGKKYGDLMLNLYETGRHAELGRSRYLKSKIDDTLPENITISDSEMRMPLSLGFLPGTTGSYPMAMLYRYYWWTSGNPTSFENTENSKKYVIGGLKYLVKECGLIQVLELMDRKTENCNSPMDLKKKVMF